MMVCLRLALFAALRTLSRSFEQPEVDHQRDESVSSSFLWIGILPTSSALRKSGAILLVVSAQICAPLFRIFCEPDFFHLLNMFPIFQVPTFASRVVLLAIPVIPVTMVLALVFFTIFR